MFWDGRFGSISIKHKLYWEEGMMKIKQSKLLLNNTKRLLNHNIYLLLMLLVLTFVCYNFYLREVRWPSLQRRPFLSSQEEKLPQNLKFNPVLLKCNIYFSFSLSPPRIPSPSPSRSSPRRIRKQQIPRKQLHAPTVARKSGPVECL